MKLLEPTFGGINLEDIRAPECFEIEERLIAEMDIPVFHDDQHGTAIISGAAFLNALQLTNRRIDEVRVVVAGAGAAGIACADLYVHLGVRPENVLMTDSKGVLYAGRKDGMNKYKARYTRDTDARTLADALRGADCFVGVSSAGTVTGEMVAAMAPKPDHLRDGEPRPGDHAGRGRGGARRRDHGDRAAATTRTRSTTCSASRSSSAARSTCARARSTWR